MEFPARFPFPHLSKSFLTRSRPCSLSGGKTFIYRQWPEKYFPSGNTYDKLVLLETGVFILHQSFVVVDVETTGNSVKKGDRIIQLGAAVIQNGKIEKIYSTYINPEREIPPFITELTGIGQSLVDGAPTFKEVAGKFRSLFENAFFVAHNAFFDWTFLQEELKRVDEKPIEAPVLDTVELSRILFPGLASYHLNDIAIQAGLAHDRPHQADSDAAVTAEWFLVLFEKLKGLPAPVFSELMKRSRFLKTDLRLLLEEIEQEKYGGDSSLPPELENYRGIILRKDGTRGRQRVPLTRTEREEMVRYQEERLDPIEKSVLVSLETGETALIETGSGGETMPWLLPAVTYARLTGKRVLVSLPSVLPQSREWIEKLAGFPSPYSIQPLKGRNQYINLWKLEQHLRNEKDPYDEAIAKMQVLIWLMETETGDREEINLAGGGINLWDKIAGPDWKESAINPWEERDFFRRAVRRAESADVILTNHYFLLAHLNQMTVDIPDYDAIIIDGADSFIHSAERFFGTQFSYYRIKSILNHVGSLEEHKLWKRIENILTSRFWEVRNRREGSEACFQQLLAEMEEFFRVASHIIRMDGSNIWGKRRIAGISPRRHQTLFFALERFHSALESYLMILKERVAILFDHYGYLKDSEKLDADELRKITEDLEEIREGMKNLPAQAEVQTAWMEMEESNPVISVRIYTRPTMIKDRLQQLFRRSSCPLLLLSSAMTVNGSFGYVREELGFLKGEIAEKSLFPAAGCRGEIFALNDIPSIRDTNPLDVAMKISDHIKKLANAGDGRLLVLFPSHDLLRDAYLFMKPAIPDGCLFLAQGMSVGSGRKLWKHFNRFRRSILFGLTTILDVIDGEEPDIQIVVYVRLPFFPPDHPMQRGRTRTLKAQGRNPFYDYSLPEAVLRFKRDVAKIEHLTGGKADLLIFDRRIFDKKYGRTFIGSLPNRELKILSLSEYLTQRR